jgi:hypothetical protein
VAEELEGYSPILLPASRGEESFACNIRVVRRGSCVNELGGYPGYSLCSLVRAGSSVPRIVKRRGRVAEANIKGVHLFRRVTYGGFKALDGGLEFVQFSKIVYVLDDSRSVGRGAGGIVGGYYSPNPVVVGFCGWGLVVLAGWSKGGGGGGQERGDLGDDRGLD